MFNPVEQMPFPGLVRQPAFYPGQMGVPGSDNEIGLRTLPTSKTLYVDNTHGNTSDTNDGTNPNEPLTTIQAAVNKIVNPGDVVVVYAGEYTESVVTGAWNVTPNYCTIIGVGPHRYRPYWTSALATSPTLDLRTQGWRISGFRFGGSGNVQSAAINLRHNDTSPGDTSIRTVIDNCYFDGEQVGRYGIETHGPQDVWIYNNSFGFWVNGVAGGGIALRSGSTPTSLPYRMRVYNNEFYDNNNHIYCGMNGSFVIGNFFKVDGTVGYAPTIVCRTTDLAGGGNSNLVTKNMMPGDFSVVGGYVATATDSWVGNAADDVAEAEVGDNGLTIAIPT